MSACKLSVSHLDGMLQSLASNSVIQDVCLNLGDNDFGKAVCCIGSYVCYSLVNTLIHSTEGYSKVNSVIGLA